ncbi:MAG: hypothetical protein Hyperionvirus12_43 [Hyperionvirus sp.]|uniref:Uncharacterized protein n=1 Tax=Hyperionvirus sp. TaxID=2487770 RepID=A0A3G5A994_9VIRU|nr:MAG: hypothetical protein Hyperionvirus12_43 [Hyperionvirus sp.]
MGSLLLANKSAKGKYLTVMITPKVEVKTNTFTVPVIVSVCKTGTCRWDYTGMIDYYLIKVIAPYNSKEQFVIKEVSDLVSDSIVEHYHQYLQPKEAETKDNITVDLSMASYGMIKAAGTDAGNVIVDLAAKTPTITWVSKIPTKAAFTDIFNVKT